MAEFNDLPLGDGTGALARMEQYAAECDWSKPMQSFYLKFPGIQPSGTLNYICRHGQRPLLNSFSVIYRISRPLFRCNIHIYLPLHRRSPVSRDCRAARSRAQRVEIARSCRRNRCWYCRAIQVEGEPKGTRPHCTPRTHRAVPGQSSHFCSL